MDIFFYCCLIANKAKGLRRITEWLNGLQNVKSVVVEVILTKSLFFYYCERKANFDPVLDEPKWKKNKFVKEYVRKKL